MSNVTQDSERLAASRGKVNGTPATSGYVILLSSVAAIGGLLFGFDSGVINGAVDALGHAFGTQAAGTGFAVASVLLGCAVGAFTAGNLANTYGRRPIMLVTALVFLATAVATGAATSAGVFVVARIVSGLAVGAASVLAPMYISEVAPAHVRGRLASLQQLAIVLGLFLAFLSNDVLVKIAGGASADLWLGAPAWRWMFWMEVVPSVIFLLGVLFIPESPRFLVFYGKLDRARDIFARIGVDADDVVSKVQESLKHAHLPRLSDLILPNTRRVARVVWVGVGLAAFQQFVGINIIFYYGAVLWEAAGAAEQSALRINLLTGFINILATLLAIGLIDLVGRKPLLLAGSVGMTVTLGTMAAVFWTAATGAHGGPRSVTAPR
jgi:MFS transporter, SP family, sugar:H+ symporter